MKTLLTLLTLLIITACASIPTNANNIPDTPSASPPLQADTIKKIMALSILEASYNKAKNAITSYCVLDSEHIKSMSVLKESGYSLDEALNLVIHAAEVSEVELETQIVLYEMLMISIVYERDESPDKIYELAYSSCTDSPLNDLEEIYTYRKELIENQ